MDLSLLVDNIKNIPEVNLHNAVKGGLIIALASSLYYILYGSVLGMSGMIGSLLKSGHTHNKYNKSLILLGVVFSSALVNFINKNKVAHPELNHLDFIGYPYDDQ
jgi:hypothetical protein